VAKQPLRSVTIEVVMLFDDEGCWWEVRNSINGGSGKTVAMDRTLAPTANGGDIPWIGTVVDQLVDRAWETAYSRQLKLPFP